MAEEGLKSQNPFRISDTWMNITDMAKTFANAAGLMQTPPYPYHYA